MTHPLRSLVALLLIPLAACSAPNASTPSPAVSTPAAPVTTPATTTTATTTPPATATLTPPASPTALSPTAPASIVLGANLPHASSEKGFGETEPGEVDFGNHPTTILRNVVWNTWGGQTATGTGEAIWIGPGQSTAEGTWRPTVIEASEVGTCPQAPDQQAYTRLRWMFEDVEGEEQPTPFDLCTGEAVLD